MKPVLCAIVLAVAACGPGDVLAPSSGPAFGQFEVRATGPELRELGDRLRVSVGATAAIDVRRDGPGAG